MSWVIIRHGLFGSTRLKELAYETKKHPLFIVGVLAHLWNEAHLHGESDLGPHFDKLSDEAKRDRQDDIRMRGTRATVDIVAEHKGFYEAMKAWGWILEHETMPGYLVFRKLRQQFPDGKTHKERMAELGERRARRADVVAANRREHSAQRRITPEMVYEKKQAGVSDGLMRSWGWLRPGQTSAMFYAEAGWTPPQ